MAGFIGALGAILNLMAVLQDNGQFLLIVFGSILQGVTYASSQNLRFAVMQFCTPEMVPTAIAYVIGGGVFAAVIGPEISKYTRNSLDQEYAGSFLLLLGIYVGMIIVPQLVDFDGPSHHAPISQNDVGIDIFMDTGEDSETDGNDIEMSNADRDGVNQEKISISSPGAKDIVSTPGGPTADLSASPDSPAVAPAPEVALVPPRAMTEIAGRWQFVFMLTCQMVSYSAMSGLMVATPVAMKARDFSFDESTSAIEFHMVGMFLPSFFTGHIVHHCGKVLTMLGGFIIMLLGALLFFVGDTRDVFWAGICIVGVGWNFSFVPSTALMASLYRHEEKSKVQAFVDIFVVSSVAIVITSAGSFYVSFIFCVYVYFRNFKLCIFSHENLAISLYLLLYITGSGRLANFCHLIHWLHRCTTIRCPYLCCL
jgi:hypothetical protein